MRVPFPEASFGVISGSSLQLEKLGPDKQKSLLDHQQQGQK